MFPSFTNCFTMLRYSEAVATLTHNALALSSSQPADLRSVLSCHIPARSLRSSNNNLLSVPRVRTTFALNCFSVVVPYQSGTHSFLVFALVRHHTHSVIFLKTHCFEQAFSYGLWPPDSVHYEGFYLLIGFPVHCCSCCAGANEARLSQCTSRHPSVPATSPPSGHEYSGSSCVLCVQST